MVNPEWKEGTESDNLVNEKDKEVPGLEEVQELHEGANETASVFPESKDFPGSYNVLNETDSVVERSRNHHLC